jgi:hypothetical protein
VAVGVHAHLYVDAITSGSFELLYQWTPPVRSLWGGAAGATHDHRLRVRRRMAVVGLRQRSRVLCLLLLAFTPAPVQVRGVAPVSARTHVWWGLVGASGFSSIPYSVLSSCIARWSYVVATRRVRVPVESTS